MPNKIKVETADIVDGSKSSIDMKSFEENFNKVFRYKPSKISIGEIKLSGACPAFKEWAARIKPGERLPRGKYFNKWNAYRLFLTQ